MWPKAAWKKRLRAEHPRARPGLGVAPDRAGPRPLCAPLRPLRRAGGRRRRRPASPPRSPRPRAGARVILCDEQAELGGALLLRARRHHRRRRRLGLGAGAVADACRDATTSACCRAPRPSATTRRISSALVERVTDHLAAPGRDAAARAAVAGARQARRARHRRDRAATGVRRQRPAGHHAGRGRAHLSQPLRRRGRPATSASTRPTTSAYARRARPEEGRRRRSPPSSICARPGRAAAGRGGARSRHRGPCRRTVIAGTAASCASSVDDASSAQGRSARERTHRLRRVLMSGGWTPSVHLFSQSRGKLAFDDATQALPARASRAGRSARPAPATAPTASPPASPKALAAGERGGDGGRRRRQGAAARSPTPARRSAGGIAGAAPHRRDRQAVKAFVDFQNDVTAKDIRLAVREGFRSIEHVKRYTTNGMATDQGKTSNMQRPRRSPPRRSARPIPEVGLDHVPRRPIRRSPSARSSAMARGDAVRPDRARRRSMPGPRRTARCSRMSASGSAPGTFPQAGEDMHAAVDRECRDRARRRSACSTPRRSARSRWSARMPPSS